MMQTQQQRSRHRRQHQAVMPDDIYRVLSHLKPLGTPVEAHLAEPAISLHIVVQDRAALLRAEDLARREAHALELACDVHAGSEAAGRVPYRQIVDLVGAAPVFVAPLD